MFEATASIPQSDQCHLGHEHTRKLKYTRNSLLYYISIFFDLNNTSRHCTENNTQTNSIQLWSYFLNDKIAFKALYIMCLSILLLNFYSQEKDKFVKKATLITRGFEHCLCRIAKYCKPIMYEKKELMFLCIYILVSVYQSISLYTDIRIHISDTRID